MTRAKAGGKIDAALDEAMAAELAEAYRKHAADVTEGDKVIAKKDDFVYSLRDRLAVIAHAIKIEAIKAKLPDDGWGANFTGEKGKHDAK